MDRVQQNVLTKFISRLQLPQQSVCSRIIIHTPKCDITAEQVIVLESYHAMYLRNRIMILTQPSEDNITTTDMLLRTSWSVWDEKSALETVDSLKTKGHREKCKVCMEQLEDWGLLEVDSKDFVEKLLLSQEGASLQY